MAEEIEAVNLSSETQRRYLNYALSVIQSRALPDVRDGLKPVQRRILYAMHKEGYRANDRTRKCAGVVGEVVKSYHPHGTQPVYEALARMAQPFSLRYPLVFSDSNMGSVDGDPPAAERYTECRLAEIAERMMDELGQETVDTRPNFDNEKHEPIALPAKFPQLLANGTTGIAVGMATNIPPHNLGELLDACLMLIGSAAPLAAKDLVNIRKGPIRGPDFPLGGKMVTDQQALRDLYDAGHGSIKVQGEWKVEPPGGKHGGKRPRIVVTSIPYGLEKNKLLEDIGAIIEQKKLPLALDMVDESNLDHGIRIVIEIKEGASPDAVMAFLFKHTKLQDNFACNFTCLVPLHAAERTAPGEARAPVELQPQRIGLVEMLRHFLDFRLETVRRRFEYVLRQLRKRIHILEGFRIVFDALDDAIEIIKKSSGRLDAAEKLRAAFKLDEEQSLAIVDLNLYRIGQLEIKKIVDELREKKREAKRIEAILASEEALWGEVKKELEEFRALPAAQEKRRTRITDEDAQPEFVAEAYIVRENTNVVLTRDGWIKRVGRLESATKTRLREGDEVLAVLPASTTDFAVFFASDGFAYTLRVEDVPASSGYGEPLAKFFRLRDGVSVVGCLTTDARFTPEGTWLASKKPPFPAGSKEWQLVAATSAGQVVRTPLAPFVAASTKAGRRFVRVGEHESVVFVAAPTAEQPTMFLASSDGHLIHFAVEEIPLLAGVGKGVRGIKLAAGAKCLGGALAGGPREGLRVENANGNVLAANAGKYDPVTRGGKGFELVKRGGLKRVVPAELLLADWPAVGEPQAG